MQKCSIDFKPMKSRISIVCLLLVLIFNSCTSRKQRDVRKLNWYEITTDARASNLNVFVPEAEFELWSDLFQTDYDSSLSRLNIRVNVYGLTAEEIRDSLQLSTRTSLVSLKGDDLDMALQRQWLFGPFDRLLPIAKEIDTSSEEFRNSEGVSSQGFAVPLFLNDSTVSFFAIPLEADHKAGALFLLEKQIEYLSKKNPK